MLAIAMGMLLRSHSLVLRLRSRTPGLAAAKLARRTWQGVPCSPLVPRVEDWDGLGSHVFLEGSSQLDLDNF